MWVALCLPRVEAQDLRPEVPPEQSYVISSAHKASFLMLDVSLGRVFWGGMRVNGGFIPSQNLLFRLPEVALESYVVSLAHKASFLMLDVGFGWVGGFVGGCVGEQCSQANLAWPYSDAAVAGPLSSPPSQWSATPLLTHQKLDITIQKPLISASSHTPPHSQRNSPVCSGPPPLS